MANGDQAIGIFDSGAGGLTVLRALRERFPFENFVYLGDTARLPYGAKSSATLRRYLSANCAYLRAIGVKAIAVACNSASAALLEAPVSDQTIPIYNVIEPGADAAVAASRAGRVGVIATRATVASGAYEREIRRRDPQAQVVSQACPLLVPLVEEGWEDDPITNLVVYRYLQTLLRARIDALVLGCTHYPALRASIARAAGPDVALVESSNAIADRVAIDFASGRLAPRPSNGAGSWRLLATDVSALLPEIAARLLASRELPPVELVDVPQA